MWMYRRSAAVCLAALLASSLLPALSGERARMPNRAVLRSAHDVTISVDLSGRIEKLPFQEAETFQAGDTLLEFDCDRYLADWRAADAERQSQQLQLENNERLAGLRAIGTHDVAVSRAARDKAAAIAQGHAARMKQCRIVAPFNGRIVELPVRVFDSPGPNQPLMRISNHTQLDIEILMPSAALRWLKVGEAFSITLDETGNSHGGKVVRVGASVDAASQTVKIIGRFAATVPEALAGMSGSVRFASEGAI